MTFAPIFIQHNGKFPVYHGGLAVVFLTALLMCFSVQADTIKLKSGKIVHGKITERSARSVQLDVGLDFPITYYSDEVEEIIEDDKGPSADGANAAAGLSASAVATAKADEIEQQGLAAIEDGRMDEGLDLLRQAVRADPQGNRHLNLGAILFGNGVALSKQDKKDEALKIFRESDSELQQAVRLFNPEQEMTLLSQAYYLLGEIYANALGDAAKAKEFYQKSLSFYGNPEAQKGLDALK